MSKKYNEIKVKDNMKVDNDEEVVKDTNKKTLTKIIDAQPKKRKRGLISRFVTGVLGPEGVSGIGSYVSEEIIVPAIKNIIVDAVTSGINMIMYGDSKGRPSSGYSSHSRSHVPYRPATNYTSRYTTAQPEPSRDRRNTDTVSPRSIVKYGVEEYLIEDRLDAAHVLTTLTEHADMYDSVSVADYYDLIGVPSQYTDNNYGWTFDVISRASIVPVRGGYIIKFPQVEVV